MQLKAVTAVNPASHCEFDRGKSDGAAAAAARVFADKHPNVTWSIWIWRNDESYVVDVTKSGETVPFRTAD